MIDNVPGLIDLKFVKAVTKDLQTFLIEKFSLGSDAGTEKCKSFLVEDPMVMAQRQELLAREKRLLSVQHELELFSG